MKSKELHIMSVGVSMLSNYFRKNNLGNPRFGDVEFWKEKESDKEFFEDLYRMVKENPKEMSAELNSFLRMVEGKSPEDIVVYLVGTDTPSGRISLRVLERFFDEHGYGKLGSHKTVHGYFEEREFPEDRVEAFKRGLAELMNRLLELVLEHSADYEIYFNPTGGFKAHVIVLSNAATLTSSRIYYIHEEFKDLIVFPPLFYLPDEEEREFLRALQEKEILSGDEIGDNYRDIIDRLESYNVIVVERKDGRVIRVKLSGLGKFLTKNM